MTHYFSHMFLKRKWMTIFSFLAVAPFIYSEIAAKETKQDYQINIEQKAGEPLSQEAYYDISFLTARSLYHILAATEALEFEQIEKAKGEVVKARKLILVVHNMLPVNTVKMAVKDTGGKVAYYDE